MFSKINPNKCKMKNIFIKDKYDPMKQIVPDIQNEPYLETMESDDSHF